MTFNLSALTTALVSLLAWYEALSHRITAPSYQPGVSWSSYLVRKRRKRVIIFESVLACDSVNHTRPYVSKAVIIDSRGETELSW